MNEQSVNRSVSRQLIIAWCAWLLISWAINLTIDPPLMPDFAPDRSYEFAQRITPAIRGMMASMILGLTLVWPAFRLSQSDCNGKQLLYDLLVISLVNQIVLWPMRALIDWPLARTLLIDLHLLVWPAGAALLVWIGCRGGSGFARSLAALACGGLAFGGYVAAWITNDPRLAAWSPIYALWQLSDQPPGIDPDSAAMRLAAVALVAAAAWGVMLGVASRTVARTSPPVGDNILG